MDMSENSLIEDILRDAANELGISKIANDKNGAPENATSQNGNQDVVSMANSFLQEVEQFKQSLAQSAAGAPPANPGEQTTDPNAANTLENPQGTDPNLGATDPNAASTGITVQTPGGSIVKIAEEVERPLASLFKIACLKDLNLNKEVE
jgi:hypothetical protein